VSGGVDTVVTIALFVALVPAVCVAVLVGLHLMMLGDKVIEGSGSPRGVWVGVIGVPLSAVAVYLTAAALAWNAHGYRFCYPIAALVVGSLLAVGLSALADRIVRGS
jgi:hypothetical protein